MSLILGIETSCDETAAAVVRDGRQVLSNVIASQHHLHERYGGVVPEIASRAHLERILPVVEEALRTAGVALRDLDAIAVGNRPGLVGSLLVGVSAAQALAWALGKPLLGIDHVQAHLYAAFLQLPPKPDAPPPTVDFGSWTLDNAFPALGLVVSGGHSSIYALQSPLEMRVIGRTIDDAVGEAYDKAAVILQAGYPGGPKLDKLAQQGDPSRYKLPQTLLTDDSLDFSFSGLKTALLYTVRGNPQGRGKDAHFTRAITDWADTDRRNLAATFQSTAIETVITKLRRALALLRAQNQPARSLIIGGGVSANSLLRRRTVELGQSLQLPVHIPPMSLCVDNAAMIAGLAHQHLSSGRTDSLDLHVIATTAL